MFLVRMVDRTQSKTKGGVAFAIPESKSKLDAKRLFIDCLRKKYPVLFAAPKGRGLYKRSQRSAYSAQCSASELDNLLSGCDPCVSKLVRDLFQANAVRLSEKENESSKYKYWSTGATLGLHQSLCTTELVEIAPGVFSLTGD